MSADWRGRPKKQSTLANSRTNYPRPPGVLFFTDQKCKKKNTYSMEVIQRSIKHVARCVIDFKVNNSSLSHVTYEFSLECGERSDLLVFAVPLIILSVVWFLRSLFN